MPTPERTDPTQSPLRTALAVTDPGTVITRVHDYWSILRHSNWLFVNRKICISGFQPTHPVNV
jgi:hypothetical protein